MRNYQGFEVSIDDQVVSTQKIGSRNYTVRGSVVGFRRDRNEAVIRWEDDNECSLYNGEELVSTGSRTWTVA